MAIEQDLPAGRFSAWLDEVQRALAGEGDADVPCDGCTACCSSSQFVHIGRDEVEVLAHIPSALLVPAPGTDDEVLLGYDEHGRCPMLAEHGCSIYEHRPRTCRTYDCRVFAATGVEIVDAPKSGIAERARRWRFEVVSEDDRVAEEAVQAAARSVRAIGDGRMSSTQIAVLAVRQATNRS